MFLFRKEYKSLSRLSGSWWLLITAFVIPFTVFYLLFSFSGRLIQEQIEGSNKKRFKVAWIAGENEAAAIRKKLDLHLQIDLLNEYREDDLTEALENDSISVGIVIAKNFDSLISKQERAEIILYYKGNSRALNIIEKTIGNYRKEISKKNIRESNLPEGIVNPIEVTERDLSNMQEMIDNVTELLNKSIATLLSLIMLIFGVIGARHAIKTVLSKEIDNGLVLLKNQSVHSSSVLFNNKTLIISVFAWKIIFLSLMGFATALSMKQDGIMQGIMLQLRGILNWHSLGLLLLAAIPLSMLFAAFWTFIVLWGRNRVNFLSNLSFGIIVFLFTVAGSSITLLNELNAFVPFLNLVYFNKAIFSGDYSLITIILTLTGIFIWSFLFNLLNVWKFQRL